MTSSEKTKSGLKVKFQKVQQTPASFDFFIAIHDFIEYIEVNPSLSEGLSHRIKANRELGIPDKYSYLRQIYQAVEDVRGESTKDLGHDRYSVIRDITRIQNKDVSDSNAFWKKRELFRKLTEEVHQRLEGYLSEPTLVVIKEQKKSIVRS